MNVLKRIIPAVFVLFFSFIYSYSQEYKVFGKIFDVKSNAYLDYCNVKLADSSYGTTADKSGYYFIRLHTGSHKLIFSYLGYFTDTSDVYIEDKDIERDIYLSPSEIMTESIDVYGEDPAYEIIRKAIQYKKIFKKELNQYEYDAYTKYIFRSNLSPLEKDSLTEGKYPILGILESETKGYFRKPDGHKEIVISKKETANIQRGFAIPYIVNFYDEEVDLGDVRITGPLADDAPDKYSYKLLGFTSMDSNKVYRIKVDGSSLYPLFDGTIYIADSSFALVKVDLSTNESASITGIDKLNFKQKFSEYQDSKGNKFRLPTDNQIYAEGGFAGLFNFQADGFTIVSNYVLNSKIPPGIFDKYAVKVMPDAEKDSSYWSNHRLVKSTKEESSVYGKIEKKQAQNSSNLRFTFGSLRLGSYLTSDPLNYYHFNRVEGSQLQMNLHYMDKSRRTNLSSYYGYGFSDKKAKYELNYSQDFLKDRSLSVEASFYRKLAPLDFQMVDLFTPYNTLMALFDKQDLLNYYYSTGYNFSVSKSIIPQIGISLNYSQEKQLSAFKNTDYSIRKHDQTFKDNPLINDGFQRLVGFGLTLDPNKYKFIDYGNGETSSFTETNYPVLYMNFNYSPHKLGSTSEFRKYSADLYGENYFNRFIDIRYRLGAIYMNGEVPLQSLAFFSSPSAIIGYDLSFRTMSYMEYLGDRLIWFNFENNFGNLFWAKVPFLKSINLVGFYDAGETDITAANMNFAASDVFSVTDKVFMEAGFGLSGILNLLRLDFAWRLNNFVSGRNFTFTVTLASF